MRALPAASLALSASLSLACKGSAAGYPDSSEVTRAQGAWCDSLAKVMGAGKSWEPLAECKAAHTTASPEYLRGMAKCFPVRLEAAGSEAPDRAQIEADCMDEVFVELPVDEERGRGVLGARCERAKKCEKVEPSDCKAGIDKLEGAQKAMLTTAFNAAALAEIADCLASASCADDEEAARDACYRPQVEKRLWFPG